MHASAPTLPSSDAVSSSDVVSSSDMEALPVPSTPHLDDGSSLDNYFEEFTSDPWRLACGGVKAVTWVYGMSEADTKTWFEKVEELERSRPWVEKYGMYLFFMVLYAFCFVCVKVSEWWG